MRPLGLTANGFTLSFDAAAQQSYTVQSRDVLGTGIWNPLADYPAQPAARTIVVLDANAHQSTTRYYRVTSPP